MVMLLLAGPAQAQSDLLVAPTRLVLEQNASSEVVVSNSGDRTSTYRVSLVLRRMNAEGLVNPVDEAAASPAEQAALQMINYAPRRVVLGPGQTQTIRIGIRPPQDLPAGEYRAHLLFRAIPDNPPEAPAGPTPAADGMSIALTPIYGVTIPIIVRVGTVSASANLVSAVIATRNGQSGVLVALARTGQGSVYGNVEVSSPGANKPVAVVKGIAIYPEITDRSVFIPLANGVLPSAKAGLTVSFTQVGSGSQRATSQIAVR